jgi:thiol-disulfide isomerase/thioredoxin
MNDRCPACGLALLTLVVIATAGCTESESAPNEARAQDRVEITLVDRAEFDAVLARLVGKAVLVDCWATWCGPCVEQLPHTVALAKQYRAIGLVVVTLNFDDPDAAEQVRKVLSGAGADTAGLTNLQTRLGGSTASMEAFEIASGALPHYKLFDRQGKLRRTFELDPTAKKQFTPADIDAAIAKSLAE